MPRLYRPHIPFSVRVKVAARQLRASDTAIGRSVLYGLSLLGEKDFPGDRTLSMARKLRSLLQALATAKGCEVSELRLDHDPPLGARKKRGEGRQTVYTPPANDPDHLFYRPHGPEHDGSHLIKTNVRGDHGQHPDRVLIKKARRLERAKVDTSDIPEVGKGWFKRAKLRRPEGRPKPKWPKRSFPKRRKER